MNRTQKFAMNSLTAAINQIVVMVIGFITPSIMMRAYGSEINGLVSSLHQFINYIILVEAGIGGAAIFSLYKPLANKDTLGVSRIVVAAKKSYTQAGYIFSAGIFILALVYGLLKQSATVSFATIFWLTIIFGATGCSDFFLLSGHRVLLTADQRNYVLSFISIVQNITRTVIICLLAFLDVNVVVLYALALIPLLFRIAFIFYYTKKNYTYLDKKVEPDKTSLNKRWDVIYQQILGTVQTGAPTVIATILLTLKKVSVFSVYNMVVTGINGLLSIFITGLPAGFGEVIAKNDTAVLKKSVSEFEVAYYYILSIVYGLTFVLILPFVTLYTKGVTDVSYYEPIFSVIIVLNGLLYNIKTPQSMLIVSAGMYKETRYRVTIQGVLILVFGFALGIPFGLTGIMIGSCISNLYRTIDLLYFVPKNITHLRVRDSLFRMIRVIITIAIIVIPSVIFKISATNYLHWVGYAVVYGIYALIVSTVMVLVFDKKEFFALVKRFKSLLFKKRVAK